MSKIFENLFVLEMANNHLGSFERGKKIIQKHAYVARQNSIKAAIKLQFRSRDSFIHKDYKGNQDNRYIKKTEMTYLEEIEYSKLVDEIRNVGCIPMATPFDEKSVELCVKLKLPIIKVASSDINDWPLLNKIAETRLPVIISSGGAKEKDLDDVVKFFENRGIELAINHCVSIYPSEDSDLNLDQIDYLKNRFPKHIIGFSTHEYNDWSNSMLISYAKGARTWERHIDINDDGIEVSKYNSLPEQCDEWYKAFYKAEEMCGGYLSSRRPIESKEIEYLDKLVRGVYAKKKIPIGYTIDSSQFDKDFYLSIPLHKGQFSVREIMNGMIVQKEIKFDEAVSLQHFDDKSNYIENLKKKIMNRGI
jgi:sialic acid synthase SpsE